jgi:hypothetical protein
MFGFKEAAGVLADGLTGAADRNKEAMKGAGKEAADVLGKSLVLAAMTFGFTVVLAVLIYALLVSRSPRVETTVGSFDSWLGEAFGGGVLVLVVAVVMLLFLVLAASMISHVIDRCFH